MKSSEKRRRRRRRRSRNSSSEDEHDTRKRSSRRDSKKRRRPSPSVRGRDPGKKRLKESKKPDKKQASKHRRRRDSSSSYSSSYCSTCRGRSSSASGDDLVTSRSRSASRIVKSRARDRSRGRERSRRSRYRSPSYSICSGYSSRSGSPRRSHWEEKSRDKDRSKSHRSNGKEARYGSRDESRDKIIQAYDDFRPSCSNDSYDDGRKQLLDKEEKDALNSRDKDRAYKKGNEVASSKINAKHPEDTLNSHDKDGAYEKENEVVSSKINTKHPEDSDDGAVDYGIVVSSKINAKLTEKSVKGEEVALFKIGNQIGKNAHDGTDYSRQVASSNIDAQRGKSFDRGGMPSVRLGAKPTENVYDGSNDAHQQKIGQKKGKFTWKNPEAVTSAGSQTREHSEVVTDDVTLEAQDLELILRQKALENFRKFRGGISATTRSPGNHKEEDITEGKISHENAQIFTKPTEREPASASPLENDGLTLGGDSPIRVRLKSIASIVTHSPDDNVIPEVAGNTRVTCYNSDQNAQNQVKSVDESSNKVSLEKPLLANDVQDKRGDTEPGSDGAHGAEVAKAEGSAPGTSCIKTENEDSKSNEPVTNEPVMEGVRGAQFEQKTYSTMRGGEVVQVSYKVYIPPNSRSLARRQLRR